MSIRKMEMERQREREIRQREREIRADAIGDIKKKKRDKNRRRIKRERQEERKLPSHAPTPRGSTRKQRATEPPSRQDRHGRARWAAGVMAIGSEGPTTRGREAVPDVCMA